MLTKIHDKYTAEGVMQYMMNAGGGYVGAHDVLNDANGYESTNYDDETGEYVYAIECYTDGLTFDTLEEDGASVSALRLAGSISGYPQGTIITGKFNKITPGTDHECGIFIKRSS
jgi:hypothetical protein